MPQMIYQSRRRVQKTPAAKEVQTSAPGPSLQELAAGAMPSQAQMGRRVDLPDAIREKMESSFGADFSGVRLYESQTVADAGAEAMTMGSSIAFAPGRLDLASTSGQALLGHELSHVVSQVRGESVGRGFLADTGLEAQADRQGMLAAQGESAYAGPVSPVGTSAAVSAAGPMQAKKQSTLDAEDEAAREGKELPGYLHPIQRGRAKQEYLDKRSKRRRMGAKATDAINQAEQQKSDSREIYLAAAEQFMKESGQEGKAYSTLKYSTRYLESGMKGRTEEERQAMLHAFSSQGSDEEIAPFLIQDIRKYGAIQSDDIVSEDDEKVLDTYARDTMIAMRQADMGDVIGKGFNTDLLVGEGKLTQEELGAFLSNTYAGDLNAAASTAYILQMMGSDDPDIAEPGRVQYERSLEDRAARRAANQARHR